MTSRHKQKHLLRHKIEQKRQDLNEQKNELISMIQEHVDGVLLYAEKKSACSGRDLTMGTYLHVVQTLDKCSNTCFFLMATAEKVMENTDSELDGLSISSEEQHYSCELTTSAEHITFPSSLEKDNDVAPVRISADRDPPDSASILSSINMKDAQQNKHTTVSDWIEKQPNNESSKSHLAIPANLAPLDHIMCDAGPSSKLSVQSEKTCDAQSLTVQKDHHIVQEFVPDSTDNHSKTKHSPRKNKNTTQIEEEQMATISHVQTAPSDSEINTTTSVSQMFASLTVVPQPSASSIQPSLTLMSTSVTPPSSSLTQQSATSFTQPSAALTMMSPSGNTPSTSFTQPSAALTLMSTSVTPPSSYLTQQSATSFTQQSAALTMMSPSGNTPSTSFTQPSVSLTLMSTSVTPPSSSLTQQSATSFTQPSATLTLMSPSGNTPSTSFTQPSAALTLMSPSGNTPSISFTQPSASLTLMSPSVNTPSTSFTQPSAALTLMSPSGNTQSTSFTQPSAALTLMSPSVNTQSTSFTQPSASLTLMSPSGNTPSISYTQQLASLTQPSASLISMPQTFEYQQNVSGPSMNQVVISKSEVTDCNSSADGFTTSKSDVTGNVVCPETPMTVKTVTLVPDTTIRVVVSEIDTPWSFYVQPVSQVLDDLRNKIQSYVSKVEPVMTKSETQLGMRCLAPFLQEDPPLYYRAQVIRIFDVTEQDTQAEVLYVDFGNTGHVPPMTIIPLPEEFSSLPAQAIFCALSGVAPANKLGVWTEDEIQGFRTCVIGQQLFLQPTYCANSNLFPYLVDLFWNIPILPGATSEVAQQVLFSKLLLCNILVKEGIARTLSISEQITKLRQLFGDAELDLKQVLFSKTPKVSQPKVEEKTIMTPMAAIAAKEEDNVDFVEEKPVLSEQSDSRSDLTCAIKPPSVGEVETCCKQNKDETLEKSRLVTESKKTVPKPPSLHHRMRRPIVRNRKRSRLPLIDHGYDDTVDGETLETKENKTDAKLLNEVSVTKDEEHLNTSLSKYLNNESQQCSSKDLSSNNSQPSLYDSRVSNKDPEPKGKDLISKLSPSLDDTSTDVNLCNKDVSRSSVICEKTCDLISSTTSEEPGKSSRCFDVLISHIGSPNNFHVHHVSSQTGNMLERLMKDLNQLFERRSKKQLKKLHKEFLPKMNSLCCAEFSKDKCFYRAQIIDIVKQCGSGDSDDSTGAMAKVRVFYLDFGDSEWLPKTKVYPLPDEFSYLPPLAIWCSLAHVVPLDLKDCDKGFAVPAKKWSEKGIKVFEELAEFEKKLKLCVVSGSFETKAKRCHAQTEPIQVFLTDETTDEEICINLELMNRDLAMLDFDLPDSTSNEEKTTDHDLENFDDVDFDAHWNPMAEDFMSLRNSYKVDVDDPGVATMGYKSNNEQRICRFFNTPGKCWRGDNCIYRHVIHTEGITQDQVAVYALDEDQSEILPEEGSVVAADVCTILSPRHFYVNLPWGKTPIAQLQRNPTDAVKKMEGEETLEDLVKSMNNYYKSNTRLDQDYTLLAPGQAVAARCPHNGMWYRAKVTDSNVEEEKVEVFFADFGNTSWVEEHEIRELQPEFLHLPQQAIECFLSGIDPPSGEEQWSDDARNYFQQLVDGKTLVAFIKSRSWSGCLHVDLYDTENSEDLNIGDALIAANHAKKLGPNKNDSSHSKKSLTNKKIKLMPG